MLEVFILVMTPRHLLLKYSLTTWQMFSKFYVPSLKDFDQGIV